MASPRILITNDDGINSPGIYALAKAIAQISEIDVFAPIAEMSAIGHAITISDPLRVSEVQRGGTFFGYGIQGTPADCVKLAVNSDLVPKPDLVVSGINQGANLGIDIIYSGTVSAAYEGTILGVPSIAVSLASFESQHFDTAAQVARTVAEQVLSEGIEPGTLLNVNVPALPADELAGLRVTRQGSAAWNDSYEKRLDPRKRTYYWLSGKRSYDNDDLSIDENAIRFGYVSLTPLHYELTNDAYLDKLKNWNIVVGENDA